MRSPTLSEGGTAGLVFALSIFMDGRAERDAFVAGLGNIVERLKSADFLSATVARELSEFHSYLSQFAEPTHRPASDEAIE